ncbi:hypothetical protein PoB_007114700 [Plakobranchus ocellatus]|uniref:Uncharacterized protein n=1 Tax=Plakobranchus ocellatus TaxID=259542 RepID=A0AAV4DK31_9GAST|nr:hypothetical protein PoB_007114700 [Plakobranchus ocellatus]
MFVLFVCKFQKVLFLSKTKKRTTALTSSFDHSLMGVAILEPVVFNSAFINGAETAHREILTSEQVAKAGIAAGVVFIVIIVSAIVICLVIKKRKERKARLNPGVVLSKNGCAGTALISDRDKENNLNDGDELQKCTDV